MSDLLARLIAAGTPADLVAEVALAVARSEVARENAIENEERRERKRANNAERQRRFKERQREEVTQSNAGNALLTSADVTPSLSRPPNENNSNPPTHTHPDSVSPRARKADPFPKPEWADPQVWSDWMEVRKAKGGRNTATAYAGFLASIERETNDEWPPGRLLAHAVTESWKSIHRPQEFQNGRSNITELRQHRQPGPDRRSSLARAIDEGLDFLG